MTPHESLAGPFAEELPWLAFLYVSEELTPDEVVDFEDRLLTDQAAREAVADATKLSEGLWMAAAMDSFRPSPVSASAPHGVFGFGSRFKMWLSTTVVAAGLAFCVGWWFAHPHQAGSTVSVVATSTPAPKAAEIAFPLPIDSAEHLLGIWSDSESLVAELASPAAEPSEDMPFRDREQVEDESFSWMLAAVSVTSPAVPPETPEVMEN